jgi:hypothetical protein
MPSRKRQAPRKWSVQQRAKAAAAAVAAVIAAVASAVTIASFMGLGPGSTGTSQPSTAGATSDPSPPPLVSIKSAAIKTDGGLTVYEVQGSATGVTDPPWRVFIVAKPVVDPTTLADDADPEGGDWMVSTPVKPDTTGAWMAVIGADQLPPGSTGVTFLPVLVLSGSLAGPPTPSPSLPTVGGPTPNWCTDNQNALPTGCIPEPLAETSAPGDILSQLRGSGPQAPAVWKVFEDFVLRVSAP